MEVLLCHLPLCRSASVIPSRMYQIPLACVLSWAMVPSSTSPSPIACKPRQGGKGRPTTSQRSRGSRVGARSPAVTVCLSPAQSGQI